MRRRNGAVVQAGLLLLAAVGLAVGPAAVGGVSVAQACVEVSCFSGVVAACGSCLPAQADAFCKSPCQPSWGSLDVITCLREAGNTYWLNNIQSLNIKCGLPPIPSASASGTDGGLGSVAGSTPATEAATAGAAGTTVARATTPATIQVDTVPEQSLSTRGGGESPAAAALASTAAGSATGAAAAGSATTAAGAAKAATAAGTAAGVVDTGSTAGVIAAGIPQSISSTGGAGTTGTAIDTGTAISSAIATFGCAATAKKLNMAVASNCVTAVTQNNACTAPCQAQFETFAAPCRNTMVTDAFYGDTWAGIFKLCSVSFDLRGPRVVDVPARLAGSTVVATAASTRVATTGNEPLLEAMAPSTALQAAPSTMVISALPLLSAAAVAALLLL